jgi:hypothetical protein
VRCSWAVAWSGPKSILDALYHRANGTIVPGRVAKSKAIDQSAAARENDLLIEDLFAFEA